MVVNGVNGGNAVAAVDLELGLEIVQTQHQTIWDFIVQTSSHWPFIVSHKHALVGSVLDNISEFNFVYDNFSY